VLGFRDERDRLWYRVLTVHYTEVEGRISVGGILGLVWCKNLSGISEWVHLGI